jgi:succinyl-CoA synthetase beta subunit
LNRVEVFDAAKKLGKPVVLKPQTLVKARGKAGLIAFADHAKEAARSAESLFGREHKGETIREILVEERVEMESELYAGIVIDYTRAAPALIVSHSGGVEIEEIASKSPDLVQKVVVSPSAGLTDDQAADLSRLMVKMLPQARADMEPRLQRVLIDLYRVFTDLDCEMVEINPLGVSNDGRIIAVDAAMDVDEDALFRHSDLLRCRGQDEQEYLRQAGYRQRGWTYLKMDGNIGILSSGAGITMAILDLMREQGGRPANFLDTAQMDRKGIYDAFKIFHGDLTIRTVLVNIFAGLNRCDDLAEGIRDFVTEYKPQYPIVVRMIGNREEQGKEILRSVGIDAISGLEDAVTTVIEVNGGRE